MRLIFIRHAEPDYDIDGLTPKGEREAGFLSERVATWKVDHFYSSPLGRAKATAAPSLQKLSQKASICEWLKEFYYPVTDPLTGRFGVPWDLMPEYFTKEPLFYDKDNWFRAPLYRTNPEIETGWRDVCNGLDRLLAGYGYSRDGACYKVTSTADDPETGEPNLVFFCHLGVTCVMLAHLIGVSPVMLWQGTYLAPSSITIVNAEKQMHDIAYFRIQALGNTAHLMAHDEPVSGYGAFSPVFHG